MEDDTGAGAAAERIERLRNRIRALGEDGLDLLFREARTFRVWSDRPVTAETLRRLHELARMGPTANNACPARFVFVATDEGRARLRPCLSEGNVDKTMAAPVTAIVAHDRRFFEALPADNPRLAERFGGRPEAAERFALRNGSLQGAYLMLAARALGLDCGPMSGFDNAACDDAFFAGTSWRSNFLCNLGYGDPASLRPRQPRHEFDAVCRIV